MNARFEINHATPFITLFAVIFAQDFFTILGSQLAVPEQHLNRRSRQSFFDIDLPFAGTNEAF